MSTPATARALPLVVTVVLVAGLILAAGSLRAVTRDDPTAQQPAGGPSGRPAVVPDVGVTDLDLGVTSTRDVADCLTPALGADPDAVTVLYGVRQRTVDASSPALVLRGPGGDLGLCDRFGPDAPSEAPLPAVSAVRPVAFLAAGRADWTCTPARELRRLERATWLRVTPDVAVVQQRYWVDGDAGRWFQSAAQQGYVHLQTWLEGPHPAGTGYAEQYRVLDAQGDVVRQTALPTRPARLSGCPAQGSASIG